MTELKARVSGLKTFCRHVIAEKQRRAGPARLSISKDVVTASDVACWHGADIKLRPLFSRYWVESGLHWLVMSISAFDPTAT
jgi:hypothetical protein